MSNDDATFSRGEVDPKEALKSHIEAQLKSAQDRKKSQLELTQSPFGTEWEIFAWGPYQLPFDPAVDPGRIIFTDETALIGVGVWMNPEMCTRITDHEDKIQLSFWTSNTQTMQPVPDLSHTCCITTKQDGACIYVVVWEIEPKVAACLYETNICARICNCQGHTLQRYAGFVRHVYDFDPEKLWPPIPGPLPVPPPPPPATPPTPGWGFDRPIRYMVVDRKADCDCDEEC